MARPARRPGNLPAETTSFIGRRDELAEVRTRFAEARMVSLIGPGGVGKTRLAMRAAADLARAFPDGVWLIELADLRDPALVAHAVLAALDLRDQAVTQPMALLLSYLRDKRLLLVVDNCEHLLAAAGRLLTDVLRAGPGVRVLATSREPLSVPGEHLISVPPIKQNEAIRLFVERSAAGSGHFELTAANQAAVVELCDRLDGLPLAIELAAVRTRVLSVPQIVSRLSDRFGLLTGGGQAVIPRHQTLRTTIDWSHDLLTVGERVLLRRLCVFAGRFTVDDVEAVCGGDDVPAAQVLDLLSSLVDKSLALRDDVTDVACYRLHETMREYARLKLGQAGETESIDQRCAEYYRDRCRQTLPSARYRLVEWLDWMDLEIDNVRAVLQRCLVRKDKRLGLDLVSFAGWYWVTRATSEGVRWIDELLALPGDDPAQHAFAHFTRGFLAILQSDLAGAGPTLEYAATIAHEPALAGLRVQALSLASIAVHATDPAEAGRLLATAEAIAAEIDDYPATIACFQARALIGLQQADLDLAGPAAVEGTRRSREAGDLYALSMMLLNLGVVGMHRRDLDGAKPLFSEALRVARRIDDRVAQYALLNVLGCHAAQSGQARRAAQLIGAAETVQRGVGGTLIPYLIPLLTQARESARATLGTRAFQAQYDAGRGMSRGDAIGLALDEPAATVPASTDATVGPLSKRETEVAQLVADGLSNKQIGARLLISEHTVDSHMRSVLTKLGFTSRAQVAAWLASR